MASLKEIQEFIKNISKTDLYKIKIKTDDIEMSIQLKPDVATEAPVIIERPQQQSIVKEVQQPVQNVVDEQAATQTQTVETTNDTSNLLKIKAPIVGTFYRKPAPDKPAFVEVGQKIKKGDTVCIIEAMKLFNEIDSDFDGEIVEILVSDSTPVEFDQPLFLVKPL